MTTYSHQEAYARRLKSDYVQPAHWCLLGANVPDLSAFGFGVCNIMLKLFGTLCETETSPTVEDEATMDSRWREISAGSCRVVLCSSSAAGLSAVAASLLALGDSGA